MSQRTNRSLFKFFSFILCILLLIVLLIGCTKKNKTTGIPALEDLNVILITVDTLSAKHLGCYSKGLKHTPVIDKVAREGAKFSYNYAVSPWTKPSMASILTGQMPSGHGVIGLNAKMSPNLNSLPELLKEKGFKTAAVVSHTFISKRYGYTQGFDDFINVAVKGEVHSGITSKKVTRKAIKLLDRFSTEKDPSRFFMFLHYFDPHFFYQHHPDFSLTEGYKGQIKAGVHIQELRDMAPSFTPADVKHLVGLYREEIAYTDFHIGKLFEHLKKLNLQKDTLVIFTADHGEEFLEHKWIGHTRTLYDELIKVPLIFYLPGRIKPAVLDSPASQIDITPTIMSLSKTIKADPKWEGVSLVPLLNQTKKVLQPRNLYAEVDFKSSKKIKNANLSALIKNGHKLIRDKKSGAFELYNLRSDPGEQKDLKEAESELLASMSTELLAWEKSYSGTEKKEEPTEAEIDPDEVEQLKSLGYM